MRFQSRWIPVLAAGVTLMSACGGPPPEKRSDAQLIAIGQNRLDEIKLPTEWKPLGGKSAARSQGRLHWNRDYQVDAAAGDAVVRELDKRILAAGWKHEGSCTNPPGIACWRYVKGGLTLWAPATDNKPCPDGQPACARVSLAMEENFAEPI
jgi:hypothetical protein